MKKSVVAVISAVVMTAGLLVGTANVAANAEPYPGTIQVGSTFQAGAPYRFGRIDYAKPYVVFFKGYDNQRVNGTVLVSVRNVATSRVITRSWQFKGWTTRVWTSAFPSGGSWHTSITFVPDNPVYRTHTRSWWLWVTPTGTV